MSDDEDEEICRVCRSNASPGNPLFHPCICTGSIGHVHQDCLVQWLRHSRKEYCELCKHKFTFKPIYSPDMPSRLPLKDLFFGLGRSIGSAVKCWMHYTLVAIAWLGIVPLTASRIYNCVFAGSISVLISLPRDMLSTKNIGQDILHGCLVVACTLSAFISLVWLRVQILNGDMPGWLMPRPEELPAARRNPEAIQQPAVAVQENQENDDIVDDNNNRNEQNEEEVAAQPPVNNDPPAQPENNVRADNINWNAVDWERGGDDPTWERILGLDGSLLFLEHIFWVIALNTLFILVFAFCPYHLGHFLLINTGLTRYILLTKFEGVLTALCGYILVAIGFLICHLIFQITKLQRSGRMFGLCYIILKVGLLVLVEIGVLPLVCGVWLDICTLKIFNSTLQSRQVGYLSAPGASIFFHWLVGMVFVFYFATFLMLLREVLRPGALWFLRNLNDPDFNPINEMIHLPVYRHFRRFLLSVVIFGSTIILLAWLPEQLLLYLFPNFLPYHGTSQHSSPIGELPLQLMVLQFILPGLLEQGHTKAWIKTSIQLWCKVVGTFLGLRSYLLGDEVVARGNNNQPNIENEHNAHVPQNPLPGLHPAPNVDNEWNIHQPYAKPTYFPHRLVVLIVCIACTFTITSSAVLLIPVSVGRFVFNTLFGQNGLISSSESGTPVLHELYTFSLGLYLCWAFIYVCSILQKWIPRGWRIITEKIMDFVFLLGKALLLGLFILAVFPLLLGLLFDLVVVIPLRVPLHQTPVVYLWQDWALGILLFKLSIGALLIGPNNWLKADIEEVYQHGLRQLDLKKFIQNTLLPVVVGLLTCLAGPYAIGHLIPLLVDVNQTVLYLLHWRTYSLIIITTIFMVFCVFEIKQFQTLCDRIKNERYLVGRRLMDYDPLLTSKS
ncbi:E3 ubiquitin-protein ligase MARCHF6-like [Clavelina lepadiformis]|uniref:E3 ubiquitin-protein ligase MARCHF6-like n=1 Tax=Clavelina lepadiformis TaxID=159417 RepID=UPI0040430D31